VSARADLLTMTSEEIATMTTTISRPQLSRRDLADLRWLASEAVADAVLSLSAQPGSSALQRLSAVAWASGCLGSVRDDPTPGGDFDDDDYRWPRALNNEEVATLLNEADALEGVFLAMTAEFREEGSRWLDHATRVAHARTVLRRFGDGEWMGAS
jgi:hypothetical protein